jgi:hypothetical protein
MRQLVLCVPIFLRLYIMPHESVENRRTGLNAQIPTAFDSLHIESFGWNRKMSVMGILQQLSACTTRMALHLATPLVERLPNGTLGCSLDCIGFVQDSFNIQISMVPQRRSLCGRLSDYWHPGSLKLAMRVCQGLVSAWVPLIW